MNRLPALCLGLLLGISAHADQSPAALQQAFVQKMVKDYGFDARDLQHLLGQVQVQRSILDAIAHPAEKRLDWGQYRKIFLTRKRIRRGLAYWDRNAATLARAQKQYGVPASIVLAIIGVESQYGQHTGKFSVLDALGTLGFHYPPRGRFFRGELSQFLRLARTEGLDPRSPTGSYAGAMGLPQFMPSSFLAYAVDFDHDHKRNIWTDNADVIGSVANYFARHGWQAGAPVAQRLPDLGDKYQGLLKQGFKPHLTVAALKKRGIVPDPPLPDGQQVGLLELKTAQGRQYWLTFPNFYVITRYNNSPLYAMAVYQLSEALRHIHDRRYARD